MAGQARISFEVCSRGSQTRKPEQAEVCRLADGADAGAMEGILLWANVWMYARAAVRWVCGLALSTLLAALIHFFNYFKKIDFLRKSKMHLDV